MSNPYLEDTISEARDDLFYEFYTTGNVILNTVKTTVFELLEQMDDEDKDNVFSMLVMGNDDAKEYALEVLRSAFDSEVSDEQIENHIVDEACEY